VNTIDPTYFPENIKEAYRLRKIHHADKSDSKLEIEADLFKLLMSSNQIIHNRGRALAYMGGADKKRGRDELNGGGLDGDGDLQPRQKREPYQKAKSLYVFQQRPPGNRN
jgi:hypothetical protein